MNSFGLSHALGLIYLCKVTNKSNILAENGGFLVQKLHPLPFYNFPIQLFHPYSGILG